MINNSKDEDKRDVIKNVLEEGHILENIKKITGKSIEET